MLFLGALFVLIVAACHQDAVLGDGIWILFDLVG